MLWVERKKEMQTEGEVKMERKRNTRKQAGSES